MINQIVQGDCLEVMKEIPDKSVDLTLSDPPYLMNYRSNRRIKKPKFGYIDNDKNSHELIAEWFVECSRVMKDNSSIYCFCSWHNVDFFKQEFEKHFKLKNLIVWNKNNHGSGDLKGAYAPKHELILFGHKGRSLLREKRIPDVIDFPKVSSENLLHPTEKPIGLLELFIRNSSDAKCVVLDSFAGSGTTAIACLNTGRFFIGIEMDEHYHQVATKRVQEWHNERGLFT